MADPKENKGADFGEFGDIDNENKNKEAGDAAAKPEPVEAADEAIDPAALAAIAAEETGDDDNEGEEKRAPGPVPYSRLSQVVRQKDELRDQNLRLEGENAELRRALNPPKPAAATPEPVKALDLKELGKKKAQALIDGDLDAYAELDLQGYAEIQRVADENSDKKAIARSNEAIARDRQQQQQREMKEVESTLEEKYPFLDPESEEVDPLAIRQVRFVRDQYLEDGMQPAKALTKAAELIAMQKKTSVAPAPVPVPDDLGKKRDQAARERAAKAANTQPVQPEGGIGARSGAAVINTKNMSEEQIKAIGNSRADLKKMMAGDFGA